jgi:hypothetical protein
VRLLSSSVLNLQRDRQWTKKGLRRRSVTTDISGLCMALAFPLLSLISSKKGKIKTGLCQLSYHEIA